MTRGGEGRKRPSEMEEPSSRKIVLKIQGPDGSQVTFRVPRDAPLQKLFRRYCEEKNFEYLAMDFILDGARVQVRRTPNELKLEDGEQIDANVRVGGGGHLPV